MENIVVKAKIKEAVKDSNVAGDFSEALNKTLMMEVEKAMARAEGNGRKTVQARDVLAGEKMMTEPMLIVKSKVKSAVTDMNTSSDFAEALNTMALWYIEQAEAKASANSRKTVMSKDL